MSLMPFTRDIFSPSEEFFGLRPFELGFSGKELGTMRSMPLDVVEKDKIFEVKADIPGVKKEDIHVEVDDNVLSIKVDTKEATALSNGKLLYNTVSHQGPNISMSVSMFVKAFGQPLENVLRYCACTENHLTPHVVEESPHVLHVVNHYPIAS